MARSPIILCVIHKECLCPRSRDINRLMMMIMKIMKEIIHTYIPLTLGVAEVSKIFLRDTHVLPKLVSYEEHCRRDRW
jgi:hypothetical protein